MIFTTAAVSGNQVAQMPGLQGLETTSRDFQHSDLSVPTIYR